MSGNLQAQATLPPAKQPKVPIEHEGGWTWLLRREESLTTARNQIIPWLTSPYQSLYKYNILTACIRRQATLREGDITQVNQQA